MPMTIDIEAHELRDGDKVLLEARVVKILKENDEVRVVLDDGEKILVRRYNKNDTIEIHTR